MLNDIIIDKLKISFLKDYYEKDKAYLSDILGKYFERSSYVIDMKKSNIKGSIIINPTRFYHSNVNLQMIPEKILLNLFGELGLLESRIIMSCKVSEIHITKNFAVQNNPYNYINMLYTLKPESESRFKPIKHDNSVYFHRLRSKNSTGDNEYTDTQIIKFYGKNNEIKSRKKNINLIKLELRELLSEQEQEQIQNIATDAYNAEENTINLEKLNILRTEISYRKGSIDNIGKELKSNEKYSTGLKLITLANLLKTNSLYSKLNEIFLKELKKNLFYEEKIQKSENIQYTALSCLNLEHCDPYYIKNVLKEAGCSDKTINKTLECINKSILNNKFYQELNKLIFDTPIPIVPDSFNYGTIDFIYSEFEEEFMPEISEIDEDEEPDLTFDDIDDDDFDVFDYD